VFCVVFVPDVFGWGKADVKEQSDSVCRSGQRAELSELMSKPGARAEVVAGRLLLSGSEQLRPHSRRDVGADALLCCFETV
jgi:hypothetical protein